MSVSKQRFSHLMARFDSARIAVLGDLMLDVYISGSASRLSQEAPVPVLRVKKQEDRLGGAANVMHNLAALAPHCKVSAFGILGSDSAGGRLKDLLHRGSIDASGVLQTPDRMTTVKQRVIASGQQVVRMDIEDTEPVTGAVLDRLVQGILDGIARDAFDALIFEDYAKGLLGADMLQTIVDAARAKHVFTSLDPHPGHPMEVKNLSLMTPNRMEAFGLAGVYCSDPASVVEEDKNLALVADRILTAWRPESLLVTLGHQGMALFRTDEPIRVIPTVAREVFDVSGAGDTVIAVYTLCMAVGADPLEAADIANHAAGIVVGKMGTATTSVTELLASF